jgi:histidinol-phosphate phosphatase family protein
MTQAVILAGGKGTRLAGRLGGLPKALVEVAGTPLLERQIRYLAGYGITDIVLLVNHGADHIAHFVANLGNIGVGIRLVDDGEPRGTAGAVLTTLDKLEDCFIVIYGDTLVNVDLTLLLETHRRMAADATLFLHPNDHPHDSDIVEVDDAGWVRRFHPYPHPTGLYLPNLVNAAMYVLEKRALAPYVRVSTPLDFGKDLFPLMLGDGVKILGRSSFEYIKDLGTPKRLEKVERDLRNGVIDRANLAIPQKAVFVDRDGTLNFHRGSLVDPDEFELLPGVADGIRRLNEHEYRVIVVTNQPVIARGEASFDQVRLIHNKLETLLGENGAYVDAIYFCPHHPDKGFDGEVAALKCHCECRKPNTGMVDQASKSMNIDRSRSWLIGDTVRWDIRMAERAGLRSILVTTGDAMSDQGYEGKPNFIRRTFGEAVDTIIGLAGRHS